jgi:hypothetical protein
MTESVVSPPRVVVVDGFKELQKWVDALTDSAIQGGELWDEPHDVPCSAVTVATIWRAVETTFTHGGEPWSVTQLGLPPITAADETELGNQTVQPDPFNDQDPNPGSWYHNVLHAALGNFHS